MSSLNNDETNENTGANSTPLNMTTLNDDDDDDSDDDDKEKNIEIKKEIENEIICGKKKNNTKKS